MPRAAASSSDPTTRAPRKRAAVKRTAAKRATTRRKAPTPVKAQAQAGRKFRNSYLIAAASFFIISGASVGIGFLDAGEINVTEKIEARNAKVIAGETPEGEESSTVRKTIPVQDTSNQLPNGGLVGSGPTFDPPDDTAAAVESELGTSTATSTASSTDETASSTDEQVGDSEENVEAESEAGTETESSPEVAEAVEVAPKTESSEAASPESQPEASPSG
ncbi:MAG: hypothetical protein AAGA35_01045 [Patescibacteria group bacterium]